MDSKLGESGSVIFNENGKCVGMAFDAPVSTYQGRVVPGTVIKHFIEDFDRNGGYTGKLNHSKVIIFLINNYNIYIYIYIYI